jgi:phosphotriesterase-related protein
MAKINGVLGPIDTADLGFTLMHEHVAIANWNFRVAFGKRWFDPDAHVRYAVEEAKAARERGVRTIVDLTPINLGRDVALLRAVAEQSGLQIVAATGFYWTEDPMFQGWEVDRLVDFCLPDILEGMQGTPAKAGIIKCATDHLGVTDLNKKLLQVAARLHRKTGVPISTHTDVHHGVGLAQQDVFEREGVDLSRVVIGHCGDTEDVEHLEKILQRGSFIGMDRFGLDFMLPMEKRVATIVELVKRGYAKQMVLSHDACCHIDWFPKEVVKELAPRWTFRHIPDDVIPALRAAGVSDADIRTMTVDNPRRIFERQGAY